MTVKMIKLELKKAFTTPWFYLSLAVLLLCALMSTVYSIDSYQNILRNGFPHYFENGKMTVNEYYAIWNCYQKWIGSELVSLASTLFFTLLPVCAVLPYASAFHQERKVGYLRVMVPQCGRKPYFLAKTLAVFLTGAVVVILPLLVNFLAVSAFVPATAPQVNYSFYNYVLFGDLWVDLFFDQPLLYVLLYILLDGLFGGLLALFAFALSFLIPNRVVILVLPLLLLLGLDYLSTMAAGFWSSTPMTISLLDLLRAAHDATARGWVVALEAGILAVFSGAIIWLRGVRSEVYLFFSSGLPPGDAHSLAALSVWNRFICPSVLGLLEPLPYFLGAIPRNLPQLGRFGAVYFWRHEEIHSHSRSSISIPHGMAAGDGSGLLFFLVVSLGGFVRVWENAADRLSKP